MEEAQIELLFSLNSLYLQQCITIRDQLQQQNSQIQQKLAEFFKKKKPDDSRADKDAGKNVSDLEQRYLKLMGKPKKYRQIFKISILSNRIVVKSKEKFVNFHFWNEKAFLIFNLHVHTYA